MQAADLPEGASPLNWDVDYIVGAVSTRPGTASVYSYDLSITSNPDNGISIQGSQPLEAPWNTPENITLNDGSDFATVELNAGDPEASETPSNGQDAGGDNPWTYPEGITGVPSLPTPTGDTPTFVQTASSSIVSTPTSIVVDFTDPNTAGNTLYVAIVWEETTPGGNVTITDSAGNNWTLASSYDNANSNGLCYVYFLNNCLAGANNVTVTFNDTGVFGYTGAAVFIYEFNPGVNSNALTFDVAHNTSSATGPIAGSGTNNFADPELYLWAGAAISSGNLGTATSNYAVYSSGTNTWTADNVATWAATTGLSVSTIQYFCANISLTTDSVDTISSNGLQANQFGFSLSDGLFFDGFQVQFTCTLSNVPDGATVTAQLIQGGTPVGSIYNIGTIASDEAVVYTLGSDTDLWGLSNWTSTIVNDPTFGVQFVAQLGPQASPDTVSFCVTDASMNVWYQTSPPAPCSQLLQGTDYTFSLPSDQIVTGIQVNVFGYQTSSDSSSIVTVNLLGTLLSSTSFTGQLPASLGVTSFGGPLALWGQNTLPLSLFASELFGVSLQAFSSEDVTFNISGIQIQLWLTPEPPSNFNYIKSFQQQDGQLWTLALDDSGTIYQEDVTNNPTVLNESLLGYVQPGTFATSVTSDDREFFAFNDQTWGSGVPRNYDGTTWIRTSQDGPGAPLSVVVNNGAIDIVASATGLVQPAAVTIYRVLWAAGPVSQSTPGTLITVYGPPNTPTFVTPFPDSPQDYRNLNIGDTVYISGVDSSELKGQDITGTYTVTNIGTELGNWGTNSNQVYSTFSIIPANGYSQWALSDYLPDDASPTPTYQKTNTLCSTTSPLLGFAVGSAAQIASADESDYDGTWTVLSIPPITNFDITNSSLTTNVATFTYEIVTVPGEDTTIGPPPVVGQLVSIIGCTNGGVILDVSDQPITAVTITTATTGTFTVAITSSDLGSTAESGTAFTSSASFVFDPGAQYVGTATSGIFGNSGGGTVAIAGKIAEGARSAVYMFLTADGYLSACSPPFYFSTGVSTASLAFQNVSTGPPNVVARWIGITSAGGANYFVLPIPAVSTETSTVILDNTTKSITLNFSDDSLLAGLAIDIQGNNRFNIVKLGEILGTFEYADRMFCWGELNKIQNLLNMGFDGGTTSSITPPKPGFGDGIGIASSNGTNESVVVGDTDLLVVSISGDNLGTITVTDNQANAYNLIASDTDGTFAAYMYYTGTAGGGRVQPFVTWSGGGTPSILLTVLSNARALDTSVVAKGTGTAVSTGPLTTSSPKEFLLGFAAGHDVLHPPALEEVVQTFGDNSIVYFTQEIIGPHSLTWTQATSQVWIAIAAAFTSAVSIPDGWSQNTTYTPTGNLTTDSQFGWAYLMTSSGSGAISSMITQPAYEDAFQQPILAPNTQYGARVFLKTVGGASTDNVIIDLYSPTTGELGVATFNLVNTNGVFLKYTIDMVGLTPATIPIDAQLRIYMQSTTAGLSVIADEVEIFPVDQPYLGIQLRVSYVNDPESFDGVTGVIGVGAQNSQNVKSLFELYDDLYIVKDSSMQATQDNGITEPQGWNVREVSNVVGTPSVNGTCYGEEWALIVNTNGLYGFTGGEPVKISQEVQNLFDLIPTAYAQTMWITNDLGRKEVYIGVPLPTPNQWLPDAPSNPNPTQPTVILMLNYRELNTISALISQAAIRQSLMGTLRSWDLARKWSIWQIPSPYGAFITRQNAAEVMFFCNGIASSKIYQLGPIDSPSTGSDDGVAINGTYYSYGFIKSEAGAANPQLGSHRYIFDYATLHMSGAGWVYPTAIPDDMNSPYIDNLAPLQLYNPNIGDMQLPLNEEGYRLFLGFSTNAIGNWFSLSRIIMSLHTSTWAPVQGGGVIGAS